MLRAVLSSRRRLLSVDPLSSPQRATRLGTASHSNSPPRLLLLSLLLLLLLAHGSRAIAAVGALQPTWRAFHGAAIVDTDMVIFGGTSDPNTNPFGLDVPGSNDLWVWSTTLRQWSKPTIQFLPTTSNGTTLTTSVSTPSPQKFLTSVPLQSQGRMMSVVGNSSTGTTQGNLLILDTVFWTWSIPDSLNPTVAPPSRLGAAVGVSNTTIFLHGGVAVGANGYATSSSALNDLTKLDDSTFEWKSIANGPSLMYHTMCKLSGINKMIIFGGSDSDTSAFNTVHTFDLVLEVWELAIPVSAGSGGSVPSARKGHSAVCLNNTMVVYGGGTDNPLDDDVWVMDASVTPWVWNRMTVNKQLGPGSRMGHSALLNGTNILVWGGYGSPLANDTNIYILDTVAWQWSSSKDLGSFAPMPPSDSGNVSGSGKNHLPLTIGVVCGSLVLIASFTAYIILRRRVSKKTQGKAKHTQDSASMLSDAEQYLSEDLGLDDKPSYYNQYTGRDSGSSLGGWPTMAGRRSIPLPAQGYAMRSMTSASQQESATLTDASTKEADPRRSGSRRSMDLQKLQRAQIAHHTTLQDPDSSLQELHQQQQQLQQQQQQLQHPGVRNGSISSDPFYPAHLAENDEEDADRWTFASSLSFDQREKSGSIPALRYIPSRPAATATPGSGFSRVAMRSTGNLTPNYVASRAPRRDGSAPSILSRHASSIGAGSVSLAGTPAAATPIGTQDTALFNSVSPLDRVSLMCSTLDVASQVSVEEEPVSAARLRPGNNLNQWRDSYQRGSFVSTTVDGEAEEVEEEEEESHITSRPSGSASTGRTFAASSHLENTTLATLIQNLPARYLVSQSPLPIHGASNDILFAVDSDTQRPIVIKSFLRREAWERECRMLRRLRGPCIVELKHVATLALSETDEPSNKHAKIRLTILERLDETLAEMLKNAREAKKVALREHAAAVSAASVSEEEEAETAQGFSLGPAAELYRTGPALDETHIKDIVKGVLRCLAWCHSKKVVYCDLQPTNIMRNRDDPRRQWKLIDLEASRTAEEERTTVGTARYCPPEVAAASHATTTTTTSSTTGVTAQYSMDLWAFGCLLYELFTTKPLIPLSATDETVLHFLAHPSPDTAALSNGLRWASTQGLNIPYFEQAVPDKSARDLISMLLRPDPRDRANLDQVLNSEYLSRVTSA